MLKLFRRNKDWRLTIYLWHLENFVMYCRWRRMRRWVKHVKPTKRSKTKLEEFSSRCFQQLYLVCSLISREFGHLIKLYYKKIAILIGLIWFKCLHKFICMRCIPIDWGPNEEHGTRGDWCYEECCRNGSRYIKQC